MSVERGGSQIDGSWNRSTLSGYRVAFVALVEWRLDQVGKFNSVISSARAS
jgi:hypothetical protein